MYSHENTKNTKHSFQMKHITEIINFKSKYTHIKNINFQNPRCGCIKNRHGSNPLKKNEEVSLVYFENVKNCNLNVNILFVYSKLE